MKANAKISVVMCTYNGARFIREQLDSILRQSCPVHEIIVQDDGSTDETQNILKEYARKDVRIKVFKNEEKHGVNGNFLSAMKRSEGDFIATADQDDIWELNKIELQMRAIEGKLLCSGLSRPFSTDGSFAFFDHRKRNVNILRMMFLGLPGHTLLFRRELLEELPCIDHSIYRYSMYDAVLSIVAAGKESIVFIDKVLVNFRRHSSATTYTDYSRSLPTWKNAMNNLLWGCKNYRETKQKVSPLFSAKLQLMRDIVSHSPDLKEAIKIMELEIAKGWTDFLRLQYHCIKNYQKLFHTNGKGFIRILRAALYPIMQLQMYR